MIPAGGTGADAGRPEFEACLIYIVSSHQSGLHSKIQSHKKINNNNYIDQYGQNIQETTVRSHTVTLAFEM